MNPFIRGKFVKVVLLGLALIAVANAIITFQHYLNIKQTAVQHTFDDEERFVEKLENNLDLAKSILVSAAKVTLTELYSQIDIDGTSPEADIEQSLFRFRSVNNTDKKHPGLRQPNLYTQVLAILNRSGHFNEIGLIAKVGIEKYQIVDLKDARISSSLLDWLNNLPNQPANRTDLENVLFSPPFVENDQTMNYLVVQLPIGKAAPLYLVAKLNDALLHEELDSTYFVWQTQNKRVVSASMNMSESAANASQNFLITRFIPEDWHNVVLTSKDVSHRTEFHNHHGTDWLIHFNSLSAAPFEVLFFKEASVALAGVQSEVIQRFLQLMTIGVSGFFILLLFLYLALIKPISGFLSFIEQQNSFYDANSVAAPKGWEVWFEKIRNSFKENRNLFNALVQKNQLLDEKIQRRTQELRRQTKSKDRNLALNRAIINSLPDMIYYKNIDGSYVGCNNAFEEFCGFTESEIVTKLSDEIFNSKTAEQLAQFDIHALQSHRVFSGKVWHKAHDQDIFINWLVAPIVNTEGELLGTVGLGRDITQGELALKEIEEAKNTAVEANRIKSEFIANMSHEIRTPITAIIGMLDLLESTAPSPLQMSYLDVASTSSNHLLQVINDILDFSRINAGMMELLDASFDLEEVFSVAFANSLSTAMEKDLLLDIDIPPSCPTQFIGDKVRLIQVLTNLINNAVKFTDSGSVTLRARSRLTSSEHITMDFSVEDTGRGIPVEKQQSIFEAFSQADSSITRRFGGTGLGLAIVFQIIELMGGKITVESQVDKGTTFTASIRLKIDQSAQGALAETAIALSDEVISENTTSHAVSLNQTRHTGKSVQWLVYEPNLARKTLVVDKLARLGQTVFANGENIQDIESSDNVVVVARPESLEILPSQVLKKLIGKTWQLQPIVFDLNDLQASKLQNVPCLPVLSMPISDKKLIGNLNNELKIRQQGLPETTSSLENTVNLHVLLVEDNEVNQQVISLMLASEGITCDIANHGEEGLAKLAKQSYDAVILDIQMPVMDGLTMSQNIRLNPQHQDLPLLAMTAHTNQESKLRSKEAGIDIHLNKPIDKTLMIKSIKQLVAERRPAQDDVIDLNDLLAQVGNSKETLSRLVNVFLETKSNELMAFVEEFEHLNDKEVAAKLHNFEGMLANLRAIKAVKAVQDLRSAWNQNDSSVEHNLESLKTELTELFNRLSSLQSLK